MIRRTADRVDGWLFAPGPGARVWVLRTGFAVLFGVRLAIGQHHELGGQPAALFRPPLFWRWLDAMPSSEVIAAVQAVGVAAAVVAVLTRRSRLPLLVAWLALVFVDGLLASRGKIMHNDLLAILAAVPVLLAPPQASWRDRVDSVRYGWPVNAAVVVVALAYTFSGVAKLISSGPAWALSDNLENILAAAAMTDRPPTDAIATFVAERALLARAVAVATLAVEVGFVLVLFRPRLRPWFALAAVGLHVGIWSTLGLDYWSWVATAVLVLVDWPTVIDSRRSRASTADRAGAGLP